MKRAVFAFFLFAALAACRDERAAIRSLSFGLGNLSNAPMALLTLDIAGSVGAPRTIVRGGNADSFPRTSGGTLIPVWEPVDPVTVSAAWIEVATGRAYSAEVSFPLSDLSVQSGIANMGVLLLPGGVMVVESDPVPRDGDIVLRDIARICGERRPELDRNMMGQAPEVLEDFPTLPMALEFMEEPIIASPCN